MKLNKKYTAQTGTEICKDCNSGKLAGWEVGLLGPLELEFGCLFSFVALSPVQSSVERYPGMTGEEHLCITKSETIWNTVISLSELCPIQFVLLFG